MFHISKRFFLSLGFSLVSAVPIFAEGMKTIHEPKGELLFEMDLFMVAAKIGVDYEHDPFKNENVPFRSYMWCEWSAQVTYRGEEDFYQDADETFISGAILRDGEPPSNFVVSLDLNETVFSAGAVIVPWFVSEAYGPDEDFVDITGRDVQSEAIQQELQQLCSPSSVRGLTQTPNVLDQEIILFRSGAGLSSLELLDHLRVNISVDMPEIVYQEQVY
ncbi:hypothetical protein [Celeribacter sp. PS-C1]|uniref:hypothetical protein n=1 Tax=Celeribacter sp. PS-C1 TaxID=2820813 RepID=UPI001CA541FE|nr:hypothetical protein [Celeribacter sp. PS-C1]MBW6418293.1 hypothetical protein [Celeribacter sp. PS-C1]